MRDLLGDINDVSRDISANNNPDLAKYVIVFMVHGIFSKLCYAFGHFASEGFTSDQLYGEVLTRRVSALLDDLSFFHQGL